LTHPAVDAGRQIGRSGFDPTGVRAVRAHVGELAKQITGGKSGAPESALEGKFDLKFCVALALHGHNLSAADFREPLRHDAGVFETARKVTVEAKPDLTFTSARLEVELDNGRIVTADIPVAKGHPGNPMTWNDMRDKFKGLVESRLGKRSNSLFEQLREFGNGKALAAIRAVSRAA